MGKKKLDAKLKEKIQKYIKNRMDISDLIKDVDINNYTFKYAIIKKLYRPEEEFNNVNFINCNIGEKGGITIFTKSIFKNCSFYCTVFHGKVHACKTKFFNVDFSNTEIYKINYMYAKFDNCCKFCNTLFRWTSDNGYGAEFAKETIDEIMKFYVIK